MTPLFDTLWIPVAVVVLGLVLIVVGGTRRSRAVQGAGLALSGVGAAGLAASLLIQTPREAVAAQTEALVAMAGPFDPAGFDAVLARDAVVLEPGGAVLLDRVALGERLDRWNGRGGGFDHRLVSIDVQMRGDDGASSLIRVRTNGGPAQFPTLTDWEVLWTRDGDGQWRASSLRWISMNGSAPPTGRVR